MALPGPDRGGRDDDEATSESGSRDSRERSYDGSPHGTASLLLESEEDDTGVPSGWKAADVAEPLVERQEDAVAASGRRDDPGVGRAGESLAVHGVDVVAQPGAGRIRPGQYPQPRQVVRELGRQALIEFDAHDPPAV